MPPSPLPKYLEHYAEPEAMPPPELCEQLPNNIDRVLIIPAYNENTGFIARLQHQLFDDVKSLLVIVVLNQPQGQHPSITRLNARVLTYLTEQLTKIYTAGRHSLFGQDNVYFWCINACDPGIDPKQGVGYARKLGCDAALHLMAQGQLKDHWLHCTDADATLPNHYFAVPAPTPSISALNYAFKHAFVPAPRGYYQQQIHAANQLYEQSLLDYANGLQSAGSAYAFTTIGSTMAINPKHYAHARGFPKRAGGEDFYLLNKLAKLGAIEALPITILLKPRRSQRVPFGTSPAVNSIILQQGFMSYHPQTFEHLGEWLAFVPQLQAVLINQNYNAAMALATLSPNTRDALNTIGIQKLFVHLQKQAKTPAQTVKMTHDWFDGFQTLKFIHALSNGPLPKQFKFLKDPFANPM